VTDFVRKQLGLGKASHFGTLDPKVTGVLPVALGRAAKLTGYFSRQDKEYIGIMHVHEQISREAIEDTIRKKFLGKIKQLPPVKSRVKRQEREREIKKFDILEQDGQDFLFRVECEAGTYIRKLVHDLGKELGIAAHMTELRRTRASIFTEKDSVTLYDFTKAVEEYKKENPQNLAKMLLPIEIITKIMPSIEVKQEAVDKLLHGSPLFLEFIKRADKFEKGQEIAVLHQGKLLGIFESQVSYTFHTKENIIAKPRTIFN
jgi:H/ACA ribonucleoprotein complex subunit 4